ncbi:hypothetical protein BDZ97DRAFT_1823356 [Flammula alnicola]|nr:hypothetical protein BDZ97DRAFT_1823356 [Flammula alnicola]
MICRLIYICQISISTIQKNIRQAGIFCGPVEMLDSVGQCTGSTSFFGSFIMHNNCSIEVSEHMPCINSSVMIRCKEGCSSFGVTLQRSILSLLSRLCVGQSEDCSIFTRKHFHVLLETHCRLRGACALIVMVLCLCVPRSRFNSIHFHHGIGL